MEKQTALSLEEITIRKIVVNFWNEKDVFDLIGLFLFESRPNFKLKLWENVVEKKVEDKISKLFIPEALKSRMSLIVKPIGLHILEWKYFTKRYLNFDKENLVLHLLKHLCWTSAGAIHYERTAEKLARLPTLDVVKRFKIACQHCLVESIPEVWQDLPDKFKRDFFEPFNSSFDHTLPEIYWAHVLTGKEHKLAKRYENFYLFALKESADEGNKEATEYFFQKLPNEERDLFFSNFRGAIQFFLIQRQISVFPYRKRTDAFCYLLSQITPEQQIQALRDCPGYFFDMFLTWQWHDLFLDKTDLVWKFLNERETYASMLNHMKLKVHFSDYYFPEMLQEFIRRSPRNFRKHLVNEEILRPTPLFWFLLRKEDKETPRVILRNIDFEDKFRLVSCIGFFQIFDYLLQREKHGLVELCIREACQSKEDRERLKNIFMEFLTVYRKQEDNFKKWQRFFEVLD